MSHPALASAAPPRSSIPGGGSSAVCRAERAVTGRSCRHVGRGDKHTTGERAWADNPVARFYLPFSICVATSRWRVWAFAIISLIFACCSSLVNRGSGSLLVSGNATGDVEQPPAKAAKTAMVRTVRMPMRRREGTDSG